MPPKVKELIAQLERYGFKDRGGKGSHRNFEHPLVSGLLFREGSVTTQKSTKKN